MTKARPYTIIIADDDREDREFLKALFQNKEQFSLIACLTSGREVFDEVSRKKNIPDILLIDMYMPHFTGIEVVKALEIMHAGTNMIKFVISTAINIPEQSQHVDNKNIIFLRKPVSVEEMKALPNVILEAMRKRNRVEV